MDYLLIVRPEPEGQFTAQVMGLPEIRAVAPVETQAIQQAKRMLIEWLARARLVQVHLLTPVVAPPAMEFAGQFDPNDPLEQEFMEELARMRREDLEQTLREYEQEDRERALRESGQECPNSSSTPTT
jgi:hypothetical protein